MPRYDCWRLLASGLRGADANFGSLRKRIEATCHASSERRSRFETSVREAQSTGRELDGLSHQTTSQQASMPREGCEEVPSRQPTKRPACHPERTLQMISCFMLCRFADSQQSRAFAQELRRFPLQCENGTSADTRTACVSGTQTVGIEVAAGKVETLRGKPWQIQLSPKHSKPGLPTPA